MMTFPRKKVPRRHSLAWLDFTCAWHRPKIARRSLSRFARSGILFPWNNFFQKTHAKNQWHITLQHFKRPSITIWTKHYLQLNTANSTQHFTICQLHTMLFFNIHIIPKLCQLLSTHKICTSSTINHKCKLLTIHRTVRTKQTIIYLGNTIANTQLKIT